MKHAFLAATVTLTLGITHAQAADAWTAGKYPSHCATAVKHFSSLPALTRDKSYQSPEEPVVNYNRIESDEPSVMNEVSNAVNAFGSMVAYGGAMAKSYDKAAKAYWGHLDRTGRADPALEREYAYWVWRRWRFDDEVGAIRAGYFQTGAGAAKFLADSLGSTFTVPKYVDDLNTAQIYDWNKYSDCSLKNADTIDGALAYEIFLDNYPNYLGRVAHIQEQIGVNSLTDDQKKSLVVAMRQAREFSSYVPPKSGIGASREQALEMIASVSSGASAVLSDFIDTLAWRRDRAKQRSDPYELFGKNGGSDYSMTIRRAGGRTNDPNAHLLGGVFMGQSEQSFPPGLTAAAYQAWLKGGAAPAGFSAMSVEEAAMCALDRFEEGAQLVYQLAPEIMEAASREKVFLEEYCTTSKGANYRSAANRAASRTKICLGDDAYRAAFWACLSGGSIESGKSMLEQRLSYYPSP